MKVIILAAGEGKRLRPYTQEKPKCLVEINGRSLLAYQLQVLKAGGITDIHLIRGYKAECFTYPGIIYYENEDYQATNMVWTLFCAREALMTDEVIISYGDIVYSDSVLQALLGAPHDISVVVDRQWQVYWEARFDNPLEDAETLKIGKDGFIAEIGQPPTVLDEIEAQYIGLMKFKGQGVIALQRRYNRALKEGVIRNKPVRKAYMTDLLQAFIDDGEKVSPVFVDGNWIEIDSVNDLNSPVTLERLKSITRCL